MSKTLLPITIVAAIARNGALGKDNAHSLAGAERPQAVPRDHLGPAPVMGRKTYQSIGKPLPGRETVVVTRDPAFLEARRPKTSMSRMISNMPWLWPKLGRSMHAAEIIIAGGAELYRKDFRAPNCCG